MPSATVRYQCQNDDRCYRRFEERAIEEKKARVEAERELRDAKEKRTHSINDARERTLMSVGVAEIVSDLQGNLEVKVEYELRKHKTILYAIYFYCIFFSSSIRQSINRLFVCW
jgi:hypothetical protein